MSQLWDALTEVERLRAENKALYAELARLPNRQAAAAFGRARDAKPTECSGAHKTGPIIWPGTEHQHVVCKVCKAVLPV